MLSKILTTVHLKLFVIVTEFYFILTWVWICLLWVCLQSPNKHSDSSLSRRWRDYIDIKYTHTHTTPALSFLRNSATASAMYEFNRKTLSFVAIQQVKDK